MTDELVPAPFESEATDELIALWKGSQQVVDEDLARLARDIRIATDALAEEPTRQQLRTYRTRLIAASRQAAALGDVIESIVDDLVTGSETYLFESGALEDIYSQGATKVAPFSFAAPDLEAVQVLAGDTFSAVLEKTELIDDDAKGWVREVSRRLTAQSTITGRTNLQSARDFTRQLEREFLSRGIGAVTYRNGRRVSFGTYGEMLLRTQTALMHNQGGINAMRRSRIQFVEILDGAECGLVSHSDPVLANGLIVPLEVFAAYPLSHPNCRRSFAARPELTQSDLDGGQVESLLSEESRQDQARFEELLASGRPSRRRRNRRPRSRRRRSRSR